MARSENSHSATELPPARRRAARKSPAVGAAEQAAAAGLETMEQKIARCAEGNRCWKCWHSQCTCQPGHGLNGGTL